MNDFTPRKLSRLDFEIIRVLQTDGRRSSSDIGRELGVSESTVRRRIDWLVEGEYVRITAVTDPLRLGYAFWTVVQLQVDLTEIERVAQSLAGLPEVTYIAVTTGAFDLLFTAIFESNVALYDFMTKKLAAFPGIKSTATSTVLHITKRSFSTPMAAPSQVAFENYAEISD